MSSIASIPYGAYWSTPFAKWQGSFANLHSVEFAAHVARRELARRSLDPTIFDHGVLGLSVTQRHAFYGLPWLMGMIGADAAGGPTIMQACATGVRCVLAAAQEIASGMASTALVVACDRTSNGPHLYYPNPRGPGGTGTAADWVLEAFACDPLGGHSMTQTAENVAARHGIGTAAQHDVTLRRCEQYGAALADDRAFLRRFMTLPFEVPTPDLRRAAGTLDGDEGVVTSTAEGLTKLKPVLPGGTLTYGGQTHPADGNAGLIVTTPARARELSRDPAVAVTLLGFGQARAERAFMPEAPVPAAKRALEAAGLAMARVDAVKTHNPFALNDLVFAAETGFPVAGMNNYGCSLVWGHPQAPMGVRSVIELIEELAVRGGGVGLFAGCAAGDTAMAVVLKVEDARRGSL